MLTKISVSGFKSLQNVEDVELGVVNVFVGANGSGKTNLLEAIGVLSAVFDNAADDQGLLRRGVRLSPRSLYKSSFRQKAYAEKIKFQSVWELYQDTVLFYQEMGEIDDVDYRQPPKRRFLVGDEEISPVPVWERGMAGTGIGIQSNTDIRLEDIRSKNIEQGKFFELGLILTKYAIYSPNTPTLRGNQPDHTQRDPIGLAGGRLAEAVGDLLNKDEETFGDLDLDELFELLDWVDDIAIVPPSRELVSGSVPTLREIIRFTDRWMADEGNRLSAYDASEGALYVLFALVLALHPHAPRLFAIDNFDQAMHPRLARATTRLFCQLMLKTNPTRQALLTTHNPLVLDGLDLRDDRIRLFAVERGSKGDTQIHRVEVSEEVLNATQEGLSLSNLWILGRLGGVPDIF